ncbi:MAG: hypothetical protein ACUVUR_07000 [bacterium]
MSIFISGLLLLLAVLAYRRQFGMRRNRLLFALRVVVIVLLFFVLTGQVIKMVFKESPRRVVLLLDRSLSMKAIGSDSIAVDVAGEITRNLRKGLKPEWWVFGESAYIVRNRINEHFSDRTRLGKALELIARTKPGALVLLSDGQDNGEDDPVEVVKNSGVLVYAVGFGPACGRNLSVSDVEVPVTVYAGDTIGLRVRLLASGFSGGETVQLQAGTAVKAVTLGSGVYEQEIEFRLVLNQAGKRQVLVKADSMVGELSYLDNQRMIVIDVKPARVNLIYITNRPGPGTRFILAALKKNPRLVIKGLIATTSGWKDKEVLESGDVFIIDGAEEKPDDTLFWQRLSKRVQAGAGLFVIAGPDLRLGGVLAGLLPVKDWQIKKGVFTPRVGAGAALLDWFEPGKIDLSGVPPFDGLCVGQPKDEEIAVWLEVQENGLPLLLATRSKKGRVAYLAGWPIWRWGFLADFPREKETPLEVLLDRVCHYLSEQDTVQFRVETDAPAYLTGEPVRLRLFARMIDGAPWSGLDVRLEVGGSAVSLPMAERGQGRYETEISGLLSGEHYATVVVRHRDSIVGRAKVGFSVLDESIELLRLNLNHGLLSRLAAVNGGWFVRAESLSPSQIAGIKTRLYKRQIIIDPRRLPYWFGLIAVLFGLELVLRRREGFY